MRMDGSRRAKRKVLILAREWIGKGMAQNGCIPWPLHSLAKASLSQGDQSDVLMIEVDPVHGLQGK
jgi:hypothetical protein